MRASGRWATRMVAMALGAGLVACSDDDSGRLTVTDLEPAASPRAAFALVSEGDQVLVVTSDGAIPTDLTVDPDAYVGISDGVAVSDDTVAAFGGDGVVLVHADGSTETGECNDCGGLAWTGSGLVTLRQDQVEGGVFDLVFLGEDLTPRSTVTARRITERSAEFTERDESGVSLLAANEETVWVAYVDRFGGGRGGSRAIAAYDHDGRLIGSTSVGGLIYDEALSPDGRYVALAGGGSGGACVTDSTLDVVDLVRMRSLDTEPRVPVAATYATHPRLLGSLLFTEQELVWADRDVLVTGYSSLGNDPAGSAGCDPDPMFFTRRFDTGAQVFEDHEVEGAVELPGGPGCDDVLVTDSAGFGNTRLRLASGEVLGDDNDESLLYVPPHPEDC